MYVLSSESFKYDEFVGYFCPNHNDVVLSSSMGKQDTGLDSLSKFFKVTRRHCFPLTIRPRVVVNSLFEFYDVKNGNSLASIVNRIMWYVGEDLLNKLKKNEELFDFSIEMVEALLFRHSGGYDMKSSSDDKNWTPLDLGTLLLIHVEDVENKEFILKFSVDEVLSVSPLISYYVNNRKKFKKIKHVSRSVIRTFDHAFDPFQFQKERFCLEGLISEDEEGKKFEYDCLIDITSCWYSLQTKTTFLSMVLQLERFEKSVGYLLAPKEFPEICVIIGKALSTSNQEVTTINLTRKSSVEHLFKESFFFDELKRTLRVIGRDVRPIWGQCKIVQPLFKRILSKTKTIVFWSRAENVVPSQPSKIKNYLKVQAEGGNIDTTFVELQLVENATTYLTETITATIQDFVFTHDLNVFFFFQYHTKQSNNIEACGGSFSMEAFFDGLSRIMRALKVKFLKEKEKKCFGGDSQNGFEKKIDDNLLKPARFQTFLYCCRPSGEICELRKQATPKIIKDQRLFTASVIYVATYGSTVQAFRYMGDDLIEEAFCRTLCEFIGRTSPSIRFFDRFTQILEENIARISLAKVSDTDFVSMLIQFATSNKIGEQKTLLDLLMRLFPFVSYSKNEYGVVNTIEPGVVIEPATCEHDFSLFDNKEEAIIKTKLNEILVGSFKKVDKWSDGELNKLLLKSVKSGIEFSEEEVGLVFKRVVGGMKFVLRSTSPEFYVVQPDRGYFDVNLKRTLQAYASKIEELELKVKKLEEEKSMLQKEDFEKNNSKIEELELKVKKLEKNMLQKEHFEKKNSKIEELESVEVAPKTEEEENLSAEMKKKLALLDKMGFEDRKLNLFMLKKHRGNIQKVASLLVQFNMMK